MNNRRKSNRREFLQGKSAGHAVADALDNALSGGETGLESPAEEEAYLVQLTRQAMACQFEVYLNAGQYRDGTERALAALDLVEQLEDQLSIFREHSEISRINRNAGEASIEVEARLFALLELALELHQQTGGAFDITAGPLSRVWGFTRRAGSIPAAAAIDEALQRVGSRHVQLDPQGRQVRFAIPNVELNLGSIGKGYALDRCAELLEEGEVRDFLLHGGNSSVLARGSRGSGDGWSIGVRNPNRPDRRLGEIRLRDRALATSGSGTQYFLHEGRRYGHILDPRSGWPADGVLSTTVIAPTAAQADALSTAFYVLGSAQAEEFCRNHPDIACVMICPGQRSGALQVHTFGLEVNDWKLLEALPTS